VPDLFPEKLGVAETHACIGFQEIYAQVIVDEKMGGFSQHIGNVTKYWEW